MQLSHYKIIRILMSVLRVLIKQPKKLTLFKKLLKNYNIDKYN
jgi:hypothetical protein